MCLHDEHYTVVIDIKFKIIICSYYKHGYIHGGEILLEYR